MNTLLFQETGESKNYLERFFVDNEQSGKDGIWHNPHF